MTTTAPILTLTRPDDWHVHLRDGQALATVVPHTNVTMQSAQAEECWRLQSEHEMTRSARGSARIAEG